MNLDLVHKFLNEKKDKDTVMYDLYDIRDELLYDTLQKIKVAKPKDRQDWKVIPYAKVKRVWESFAKLGFVRDENILEDMAEQVIHNILQLDINTELCGHKQFIPEDAMEDVGITQDELDDSKYLFDEKAGHYRISDYAMDKLNELALKIAQEEDSSAKLILIDQVFNTVHERSDIAAMFIEGGSSSLNKLAGYEKWKENESKKYVLNFKEFCLRESLMRLLNSKGFTNNFYNLGGSTIEKSKNKIYI